MRSLLWFRLAAFLVALILCVAIIHAWRADRRDRAQLAAELASTKQLLAAADARQHDRDAQLAQTLAALAEQKRSVVTPAQILRNLPNAIPLPAPITLQADGASSVGAAPLSRAEPRDGSPSANASTAVALTADVGARLASPAAQLAASSTTTSPSNQNLPASAIIPAEDLKPLYDFALDCKACQARLSVAQSDLADERTKTAALAKERDRALQIARGGSLRRRIVRAAKWFVLGAAAGAIAAKSAH